MSTDLAAATPVAFVCALRAAGLEVPVSSSVVYVRALSVLGIEGDSVYWAGRATLLCRSEDVRIYDDVFATFWRAVVPEHGSQQDRVDRSVALGLDAASHDRDEAGAGNATAPQGQDVRAIRFSATEVLRSKDLAACTADELLQTQRLMAGMRVSSARRKSRRSRRLAHGSTAPGARLDLRATVRIALRNGGEPIELVRRAPKLLPRRLLLLIDVSGSMDPYARALVRFAHVAGAGRGSGRVDVFALGTRLTRLSRQLASRDPDDAMRAAAAAVPDWSGGTRLGAAFRELNDTLCFRGLARGAVVVVLSDGWDRGDPAELAEQMARLHRAAHQVVWVNPLKASAGYAPTAGGMAAALPHVDHFIEGHSVASLEHLADVISSASRGTGSRAGEARRWHRHA
ncbi:MAG: vWA domain-containing protein [Acidimicrobiales bacterium]